MIDVPSIGYAPTVLTATVAGAGVLVAGGLVALARWGARTERTVRDVAASSERMADRMRRHERVQRGLLDSLADIAVFVQPLGGGAFTPLCLPQRFVDVFAGDVAPADDAPLPPFVRGVQDAIDELRARMLAVATHSASTECETGGRRLQLLGTLLGEGALAGADLLLVVRDVGPDAQRVNRLETAAFLSGGVVHDLYNLLNTLVMHAELGRERVDVPMQAASHFERIGLACQRAAELTGLIRRYLRDDTPDANDDDRPVRTPLRVAAAIEEAITLLRPSLPRAVQVALALDEDAMILGEAVHVHQIVSNLLLNAAHALAGHPAPRIAVRVRRTGAAGEHVEVVIEDNGPGMPADVRARCFEPFFTTKPAPQGTGLGLAVVYAIATDVLRGTIAVDDVPTGGARFTLRLPAHTPRPSRITPAWRDGAVRHSGEWQV